MAQVITKDNLQDFLDSGKPLMIDFWAEWCGPCRMIAPIVDELAAEYDGKVTVAKCDIEQNDAIAVKYGIRNIPTLLFIKGGEIVDKQVGAATKGTLEEKLAKLL